MIIMAGGWNRQYRVPRTAGGGQLTAWEMLDHDSEWANKAVDSLLSSLSRGATAVLDCVECEDTGFYGREDGDTLTALIRLTDVKDGGQLAEQLTASGSWEPYEPDSRSAQLVYLDRELAGELSEAILAGAVGLVQRFYWPIAFLPPADCQAVTTLTAATGRPTAPTAPADAEDGWLPYAVVDELDTGAVLSLIRMKPGPEVESYTKDKGWAADQTLLTDLQGVTPPPLVELDAAKLQDVISQIDSATTSDDQPDAATANTEPPVEASAALVASRPLTVSPDPRAEKLRRYWSTGKGGLKIKWGAPGDWKRCFRHLSKFMGLRAKGYCNNMHKRTTGMWTGSRLNASAMSTESALTAALQLSTWTCNGKAVTDMIGLKDGIYAESDNDSVARVILAGGYPVAPPDEWFANPALTAASPITVEDSGRVYGHLADWSTSHIGLPGRVHAPRSKSNYAYFATGALRTASGKDVPVGQLTLVGGHAPLSADASTAVAHYDNTKSAIVDVSVGEDKYGIWVAGALRPEATPEQVRAFRASALSGDWRPIGGNLELVAACAVNVPGFPIARARVAGGAVMALVAAGSHALAVKKASLLADAAVVERLAALEAAMVDGAAMAEPAGAEPEAVVLLDEGEKLPEAAAPVDKIAKAREMVAARKRDALRARVHPVTVEDPAPTVAVAASASRAELRRRVHDPKALASDEGLTAGVIGIRKLKGAFKSWMHPRGKDGRFIDKGSTVTVDGKRRAKITELTEAGPELKFADGKKESDLIPLKDVARRLAAAPEAKARLDVDPRLKMSDDAKTRFEYQQNLWKDEISNRGPKIPGTGDVNTSWLTSHASDPKISDDDYFQELNDLEDAAKKVAGAGTDPRNAKTSAEYNARVMLQEMEKARKKRLKMKPALASSAGVNREDLRRRVHGPKA